MSAIATQDEARLYGKWRVDPARSNIEFRVKHLMVESVKGRFLDFDGAIEAGEAPSIAGSIRTASLDTNHEERDLHLRSSDFFDVERTVLTDLEVRRPEQHLRMPLGVEEVGRAEVRVPLR